RHRNRNNQLKLRPPLPNRSPACPRRATTRRWACWLELQPQRESHLEFCCTDAVDVTFLLNRRLNPWKMNKRRTTMANSLLDHLADSMGVFISDLRLTE